MSASPAGVALRMRELGRAATSAIDRDVSGLRLLRRLGDSVAIGVVFVLLSLPVLTLPLAWVAACSAARRMRYDDHALVLPSMVSAVRSYLGKCVGMGLGLAALVGAGLYQLALIDHMPGEVAAVAARGAVLMSLVAAFGLLFWVGPSLARCERGEQPSVKVLLIRSAQQGLSYRGLVTGAGAAAAVILVLWFFPLIIFVLVPVLAHISVGAVERFRPVNIGGRHD